MPFQKMAVNVVEQANELLAQEDYANIEEIQQQVQEQLNDIDAQYRLQTGAERHYFNGRVFKHAG